MHSTRPDLAYGVIKLSQYASRPREIHWQGLKRILRYLKGTIKAVLTLGRPCTMETDMGVIGYFDAAHADNVNWRSTCGYIFPLDGSPISWSPKIQRTVGY